MRITANKLTTVRILLIPIPCVMLLTGTLATQLVAWALYIVIGVTDFFDGLLARRYGSTVLGALLDPIADKIYVALLFLPLSLLGFVPGWMVAAVIIRDPIITCFRSLSQMRRITMKTASLAKYKTAIQMIAGGYMLWTGLVPDRGKTLACMTAAGALCWFFFLLYLALKRRFSMRLFTLAWMPTLALGIRFFASGPVTLFLYGLIILAVTWASALHYTVLLLMRFRSGTGRVAPVWWVVNVLESVLLPLLLLCFHGAAGVPAWVPMTVLCLEFASGALDNVITEQGALRALPGLFAKIGFQLAAAFVVAAKLWLPAAVPGFLDHPVWVDSYALVGITLLSLLFFYAEHGLRIIAAKHAP